MDKRASRSRSANRPKKTPVKEKAPKSKSPPKEKTSSKSKSQQRKKSPAPRRPRSPSVTRTKSASSRSRSRGRQTKQAPRPKSKTRRSTSRSPPKPLKRTSVEKISVNEPTNKKLNLIIRDVMIDDHKADTKLNEIIRKSLSREPSASLKNESTVRRSTRISSALKEVEEKSESNVKHIDTYSKKKSAKVLEKFEFGGWPGAIFGILFAPCFTLLLHLACTREQCTLSKFHIPRNLRVYFNLEAAGLVVGFLLLQTILTALPVGRRIALAGRSTSVSYRCNGFLSAVITGLIVGGLWYFKYPVTIVYERYIPLLVTSAILGPIIALFLYLKGGRAPVPGLNPYGMTGNRIYDFFVGREINPVLFKRLNIKTVLFRVAINGTLLLNSLMVLKAYEVRHELSYTLLCHAGLLTLLVVDLFWFEESMSSTFESLYEGTGSMLAQGYLLAPFLITLIPKFIIQQRVELPIYALVIIVLTFLVGFFIYRASNLQKAAFRKNPLNPALAHFETISTSRGKKLLVSGWWGWVRHPNYLGDIILQWALASTVGYTHAIPYAIPLLTTLYLLHRAKRDNARCRQRYQSAWDEYCSRVRYHILPRVY